MTTRTKFPPIVVQNADIAAKPAHYATLPQDTLLVTSTFATIQGEGPWTGQATFFIRLAGCNFGTKQIYCLFCDTKFDLAEGTPTHSSSLLEQVAKYAHINKIVVTGGEPCLQKNLVDFVYDARSNGYEVQIETNGSQLTVMKQCKEAGALIVCSPKASIKGHARSTLITRDHVDCLKFVVSANPEDAHAEIPLWASKVGVPIYVSPMTVYKRAYEGEVSSAWDSTLVNQSATRANYRYAGDLALRCGYIVSIQMHTFLEMA